MKALSRWVILTSAIALTGGASGCKQRVTVNKRASGQLHEAPGNGLNVGEGIQLVWDTKDLPACKKDRINLVIRDWSQGQIKKCSADGRWVEVQHEN